MQFRKQQKEANFADTDSCRLSKKPTRIDILKVSNNNQEMNCFSKELNRCRCFRKDKGLFIMSNKRQQSIMIFLKLTISELFKKKFITTLVFVNQLVYCPNNSRITEQFDMTHFQRKAPFQIYFVLTLLNKKAFSGCENLHFRIAK